MSGSATQIKLLTDCIQALIDDANNLLNDPNVIGLVTPAVSALDERIESAQKVLEIEARDWLYWTPTAIPTDYNTPLSIGRNEKLEVQFEDGDLMVCRSNHVNWGDANSWKPGRSVFRYRKLQ